MRTLLVALMVVGAVTYGCGRGLKVETDFDPNFDFSTMKTYGWAERILNEDDDPRIYDEAFAKKVRFAVDMALKDKGIIEAWANPDLLIGWHGSVDTKMSLQTINDDYTYHDDWTVPIGQGTVSTTSSGGASSYAREWDEGTLMIDIVSAATKTLVWRGTGTVVLEAQDATKVDQEEFNKTVAKILAKFPPRR